MYMELGRIIRLCKGEKFAIIRVNWLTKFFVVGDVIAFFTQAAGAGLLASANRSTTNTGKNILIVGLIIQIIFFGLFFTVALLFHFRIARLPTQIMRSTDLPWKKHLVNIYAASTLVLIRCIFRLIEYIRGKDGYLLSNDWPMYVFDTLLIATVMAMFAIIHPSEVKALLNGTGKMAHWIVLTRETSLPIDQELTSAMEDNQYKYQPSHSSNV